MNIARRIEKLEKLVRRRKRRFFFQKMSMLLETISKMISKMISKTSRDNFNKTNVVARRACKYFLAHVLLVNQLLIYSQLFNSIFSWQRSYVDSMIRANAFAEFLFTNIWSNLIKMLKSEIDLFWKRQRFSNDDVDLTTTTLIANTSISITMNILIIYDLIKRFVNMIFDFDVCHRILLKTIWFSI